MAGGLNFVVSPTEAELYDPVSGTFSAAAFLGFRFQHTATLLPQARC